MIGWLKKTFVEDCQNTVKYVPFTDNDMLLYLFTLINKYFKYLEICWRLFPAMQTILSPENCLILESRMQSTIVLTNNRK